MADVRQKPKMDGPKTKNMDSALPKDARRMLAREYREAAGERANDVRQRPEHEAVGRVEDSMRSARDHGFAAAKSGGKQLLNDGKKAMQNQRCAARPEKAGRGSAAGRHNGSGSGRCSEAPTPKEKMRQEVRRDAVKARQQHKAAVLRNVRQSGSGVPSSRASTSGKSGKSGRDAKMKGIGGKEKLSKQRFSLNTRGNVKTKARRAAKGAKNLKRRTEMVKQAAQKAAKATATLVKKVVMMIAKAAAAVGKALMAAAGPVAVVLVIFIVIAAIASIFASPFGLFASGEDADSKAAMQQVVAEISYDYQQNILDIIYANSHDELRFEFVNHGNKRTDNWIDVLTVYAVDTANFGDDGIDVVELDDERIEKLRAIFWEMQDISFERKNEPKRDPDTNLDVDHYVLYIRAECVGAWTMADSYGFDSDQREVMTEMLSGEYDEYYIEMIGSAGLFGAIGNGGAVVGTGNFIWPSAASTYVTSRFGSRIHPITGEEDFHGGIDISAGEGTGVLAADGGKVISDNIDSSYGIHLLVDHGNGYQTLYAHMSAAHVGVGDDVEQGQVIGAVGSTGSSTNPHLHFEVRYGGTAINPLLYFDNHTIAW